MRGDIHTLNIELARKRALKAQLEQAKQNRKHDDITPIAAEIRHSNNRITDELQKRTD